MQTAFRLRGNPGVVPPPIENNAGRISSMSQYKGMDVGSLARSLPSPPPMDPTPIARYKATYFGTVSVPLHASPETIPDTVHRVMKGTSLAHMIDVFIDVWKGELKVTTAQSHEDIKVVTTNTLSYTSISRNDDRVIVFVTRMVESRVPLLHGHVFATDPAMAVKMKATVDTYLQETMSKVPDSPDSCAYQEPAVEPVPQEELLTVDAFYLGYVRVLKKDGARIVKKAADVNAAGRAAMQTARERKRVRKAGILRGGAITTKGGITVEDDPVTIVVTPRSFRIVDRLAGETLFKTLVANITFATSSKGKDFDLFGCIVFNERLSIINCHLFHVHARDTARLGRGVADALTRCKKEFGDAALSKSVAPWAVDPDSKRQSAPSMLFAKQIHRTDLRPLAVIGAGEYGEVFLGLQSAVVRDKAGKSTKIRVPRAVKMASNEQMKDDFVREALIMLQLGDHDNIVRMVGVAVQQSPWLAVLEFVQYGDLRAVLKACREDDIVLSTGEQIHFMRQLSEGCAHINSMGILHMDLAARNCLLGIGNVVKVGDFGMSRMMCEDGPYLVLDQKIPLALKWMSIEAMDSRFFSEGSDCWSFGVLMWEILTYGEYPYPGLQLDRIQVLVREGLRLDEPEGTPPALWGIIERCWKSNLKERWKFVELTAALEVMGQAMPVADRDLGMTVAGAAPPAWALVDSTGMEVSPREDRRSSSKSGDSPSGSPSGSPKGTKKSRKKSMRSSPVPPAGSGGSSPKTGRQGSPVHMGPGMDSSPMPRRRSSLGTNVMSSPAHSSPARGQRSGSARGAQPPMMGAMVGGSGMPMPMGVGAAQPSRQASSPARIFPGSPSQQAAMGGSPSRRHSSPQRSLFRSSRSGSRNGSPAKGPPMQNHDPHGALPNFGAMIGPGSGRMKAQGALRGKLPPPPGAGGGY